MDAMPWSFVPPVSVEFRREDGHVIAFLTGHAEYEAVEAFVSRRAGASPLLRAILTRHDKTQVDHVNDPAVAAGRRASGSRRSLVVTDVRYAETTHDGLTHTRLAFTSFRGERTQAETGKPSDFSTSAGAFAIIP